MKKSILVAATLMLGTTGLFATSSYAASNLVAYYSTGGATEQLAKNLAGSINADTFHIPLAPSDKDAPLSSEVKNFEQYKVIFIGFPIRSAKEPDEVDMFLKSYDFSDKTIVPFFTVGNDKDITAVTARIKNIAPNAKVETGRTFHRLNSSNLKPWASKWL